MADETKTDRRGFLKLAAVGAPAAAVAAAAAPKEAQAAAETGDGLRKTPHVQAYLDSARF